MRRWQAWIGTVAVLAAAREARADDPPATADAPPTSAQRPTPLEVDYAQYGLAIGGDIRLTAGAICPEGGVTPCIIGGGGGPVLRGGYRPAGPWYFGGAYGFSKLDSNNQFRLAIFQEARAEFRYFLDFGSRIAPYLVWGGGGVLYGNEFGADTAGASALFGVGAELEITRFALLGVNLHYHPVLLAGYTDTTGQVRNTGVTQFVRLELVIELRSELGRE